MLITSAEQLWPEIETVHDLSFELPDKKNCLITRSAIHGQGIVGAGFVIPIFEGILTLDKTQPLSVRVEAAIGIIESLKQDMIRLGHSQCHVFVKNAEVERFLKHLGFKDSVSGKALIIDF